MLSRMVHHGLLLDPVDPRAANQAVRRFGLDTIGYPIATLAGLIWPPLTLVGIGSLTSYYMVEQTQILPSADRSSFRQPRDSRSRRRGIRLP
jgi:hypothetical protein